MVMTLQVVGAGLGRTGTNSVKVALERLLGGRVHHMYEVFLDGHRQFPLWQAAADGAPYEQWASALDGFVGAVDWPSCRWYELLSAENPDAIVVLSRRRDADTWWRSADRTIFQNLRTGPTDDPGLGMIRTLLTGHIGSYDDPTTAMAAYDRHNDDVRERIPPDRLVEWQPEDGWTPLCEPPWVRWRLLTLETRMESCHRKCGSPDPDVGGATAGGLAVSG